MMRMRGRLLACFYCGKRSSIRYDGRIRDFLCTYCEATNYLDENGDITDPPALESSTPKQFAKQLPSRPASPTDSIFCEKCLKNQRLFTASLAQYLPDDPSHPDYAELERKYYRYRKDLEKRYPQVCSDCAKRVEDRINQAGYTAKTDHLRRMMEKSRGRRVPKRMTSLDVANAMGRWLWWGGLVIQIAWHLVSVSYVLEAQATSKDGMVDPDDESATKGMISWLSYLRGFLPAADTLIRCCINTGFLSAWWNPHFVQFNRGFTRHLLGFTQWYCFQGLIIFFRYIFRSVLHMQGGQAQSDRAQISAHFAMACIMGLIYSLARKSIKVDTTPLFGVTEKTVSASQMPKPTPRKKIREPKTLAEALTEALESAHSSPMTMKKPTPARAWESIDPSPIKRPMPARAFEFDSATSSPTKDLAPRRFQELLPPSRAANPFRTTHDELSFAGFSISDKSPQKGLRSQDPDAMDWSPVPKQLQRSQYRAFQDSPVPSKLGARPFGQSPTQPDAGPFWFKVPAAPTNPAQRLRNLPSAPLFNRAFSEPRREEGDFGFGKHRLDEMREEPSRASSVDFKGPSFFAPEDPDDTDALADALGQSFTFANDADEESDSEETVVNEELPILSSGQSSHIYDLYFLVTMFLLWFIPLIATVPYCKEAQLTILSIAGIIAIRSIGGATQQLLGGDSNSSGLAMFIASVTSVGELSALCWTGWQLWTDQGDVFQHGAAVLASMLGHQVLRGISLRQNS
ncbi:integral inner nuclear membrane protein ima1 [Trichoderma asperellum]|uniref:Integral inner nuclear membrane protein ima1 n=1 Tax=Trichoderma asperellum TaxID=101201 RepID=A0A6V8R1S5_TRIAP|nr:integral inner nuclear membrane protein ima1 [Trichoderma asperellum]